jgi:hypothetical protein
MTRGSFFGAAIGSEFPAKVTDWVGSGVVSAGASGGLVCGAMSGLWLFLPGDFASGVLRFPGEDVGLSWIQLPCAFFLSRKVMEEGGMGAAGRKDEACAIYCSDPASRDENMRTARSSHPSVAPIGVKDCFPPRRFLVDFSSCEDPDF